MGETNLVRFGLNRNDRAKGDVKLGHVDTFTNSRQPLDSDSSAQRRGSAQAPHLQGKGPNILHKVTILFGTSSEQPCGAKETTEGTCDCWLRSAFLVVYVSGFELAHDL